MKKIVFSALISGMLFLNCFPAISVNAEDSDIFYEDFSGGVLDSAIWLTAYKNWGGTITENGQTVDYNGGVIPENVNLHDGKLILTGYGNQYTGDTKGINRNGIQRENGQRTGGAIATKEYFASGSYEISAKIAPELGCCSAMWTFEYEEDYSDDNLIITNHEIDIEFPGRDEENQFSLQHVLCTNWTGEGDDEHQSVSVNTGINPIDGEFHTYRFDWHTGDQDQEKRVEYYIDNILIHTSYEHIPDKAGRFWLGLWFPKYWAGVPDFDTAQFEIDYVKITPFHEAGDQPQNESYPDHGWAQERVQGDVNADGEFNTLDLITLHRWLMHDGTSLSDWKAGNFLNDEIINIYDFCLMKRNLIAYSES